MPVEKREKKSKKDAEEEEKEEDKTYEPGSSAEDEDSEDEESGEEERSSESEDRDESESSGSDAEELPSASKPLKDIIREEIKEVKKPRKRKSAPARASTPVLTPAKKIKTSSKPKTKSATKSDVKKKTSRNSERKEKTGKPETDKKKENLETTTDEKTEKDVEEVKKRVIEYNDKNVDYNLYTEAPEHIKTVKCQINSNTLMICRMIEASSNSTSGLTSDYAAISFVRLSRNGKAFEFNLPLGIAPNIIKGLTMFIKDNPRFFDKHINSVNFENLVK